MFQVDHLTQVNYEHLNFPGPGPRLSFWVLHQWYSMERPSISLGAWSACWIRAFPRRSLSAFLWCTARQLHGGNCIGIGLALHGHWLGIAWALAWHCMGIGLALNVYWMSLGVCLLVMKCWDIVCKPWGPRTKPLVIMARHILPEWGDVEQFANTISISKQDQGPLDKCLC